MNEKQCPKCEELLRGETNKRHSELERKGLYRIVSVHGNRDDEYYYRYKTCCTQFVVDSCGTWSSND